MARNNYGKPVGVRPVPPRVALSGVVSRYRRNCTFTAGNILNRTPYTFLVDGAANVQRQIEYKVRISQIRLQLIAYLPGESSSGCKYRRVKGQIRYIGQPVFLDANTKYRKGAASFA